MQKYIWVFKAESRQCQIGDAFHICLMIKKQNLHYRITNFRDIAGLEVLTAVTMNSSISLGYDAV
jgi:hypothetical protein